MTDASTWAISQRTYTANASDHRYMNYWENATEFYPNTENYEVWDKDGYTGNDLKGLNVRHHHFPSNRNGYRKSITDDNLCRTTKTSGSSVGLQPWTGKMCMLLAQTGEKIVWYKSTAVVNS